MGQHCGDTKGLVCVASVGGHIAKGKCSEGKTEDPGSQLSVQGTTGECVVCFRGVGGVKIGPSKYTPGQLIRINASSQEGQQTDNIGGIRSPSGGHGSCVLIESSSPRTNGS